MTQEELPNDLIIILSKMFEFVGVDSTKIDINQFTKEQDWFLKYEWDLETEEKFKVWLNKFLKENKKIHKELTGHAYSSHKDSITKVVNGFCLNYGWKYKNI